MRSARLIAMAIFGRALWPTLDVFRLKLCLGGKLYTEICNDNERVVLRYTKSKDI